MIVFKLSKKKFKINLSFLVSLLSLNILKLCIMKKKITLIFLKKVYLLFILLSTSYLNFAQSCDQLEIVFTEPECFKTKDANGSTDPRSCKTASACVNTKYKYSSSLTGIGYTYNWAVAGPAAASIVPNNTAITTFSYPVVGNYTITLTVTDNASNTTTTCLLVTVKPKPIANFTFGPNGACKGSPIYFNNSSTNASGGMVYSWNFGDETSGSNNYSDLQNPSHSFNSPGIYKVCLVASSFDLPNSNGTSPQGNDKSLLLCCSDTICYEVRVNPGDLTLDCISTVCPRQVVTYTANGCNNVTWNTVIGGTILGSNGNQITIEWGNGVQQGSIIATCSGGCRSQINIPIIPSNAVPVGDTTPCLSETTTYTLTLLPGTSYTWQLKNLTSLANNTSSIFTYPDNNVANINWSQVPFAPGDVFELSVILDNQHICCSSSGSINITPNSAFSIISNSPVCLGSNVSLFAGNGAGTINWSVVPVTGVTPTSGTGSNFVTTINNAGTYTITAIENTNAYCNSSASAKIVVLPATPTVGTINGPSNVCIGSNYSYSTASPAPFGYHYTWTMVGTGGSFQPGNLSNVIGNNVTVKWTSLPATFNVMLERDNLPNCPSPIVSFTASVAAVGLISGTTAVCVDGTGTYNLSGTYPASEAVTWSIIPANAGTITLGQGTSNITVLWHGQAGAGPWNASISATTGCGNPPTFNGIVISPKFSFTLNQTNDICAVGGANLSPSTTPIGTSFLWSNGSTTASTSTNVAGFYTLTGTSGGCSYSRNIEVLDPIKFRILQCGAGYCGTNGNTNEVLGVDLISPVSGVSLQWFSGIYPGGTAISGQTGTTFIAPNFGAYYLTLTYGTCVRVANFNVEKVCCPDVNFPNITTVTQNSCNNYTFIGTYSNPTGAPVTWYFDNVAVPAPASGTAISYTFLGAGLHCAKLCVGSPSPNTANCIGNCAAVTIVVPIDAAFTYTLGCNGKLTTSNTSLLYPAGGSTLSYNWDYGDGSPLTTGFNPPPHQYPATGGTYVATMTISYTVGSISCTDAFSQTITYTPLSINITPLPVCTGIPVSFSSNPTTFDTYSWAFGDNTFAFTPTTTHIFTTTAASNTATLNVTDLLGNVCTASQMGTILASPTLCTIIDAAICDNTPAQLLGPAGGVSYQWQFFNGTIWVNAPGASTSQNYGTLIIGKYRVLTYNAAGCACTSNSADVLNPPKPQAKIQVTPTNKLCTPITPGPFALISSNHLAGYNSAWYVGSVGGTPVASGQYYYHSPPAVTTNYFLVLTNEYGCTSQCNVVVEVNPTPNPPVISSVPAAPLCEGQAITLSTTPTSNISWNTGENTPSINVFAAGKYTATFTNILTGCKSSSSIIVNPAPNLDLFPHFCDSIPCKCSRPFIIYGPKPLVGPLAVPVTYNWYDATNTLIFSGANYSNLPSGVKTGTYSIVATNAFGCTAKSDSYTVEVPECIDCNCEGSQFNKIFYTLNEDEIRLECNKTTPLPCNSKILIDANFACRLDNCPSNVNYTLTFPNGIINTGSLPLLFNPTTAGSYVLLLTGYCNGQPCTTCKITFDVTCTTLAVNLLSFTAKPVQNEVLINWATASEKNNQYFILERAGSNMVFESIFKTNGKVTTSEKSSYSFIDKQPIDGVNYYQLKAVDMGGKISNSKIIVVKLPFESNAKVSPNPVVNVLTIQYRAEETGDLEITIIDATGRKLHIGIYKVHKGQNKIQIPVEHMYKGKYWINGNMNNERKLKLEFVK